MQKSIGRARFAGRLAAVVGLFVALLMIAGTGTRAGATGTPASSGVVHARAELNRFAGQMKWVQPGPTFNANKARGKTVMYLGTDMSIPILQTIAGQAKVALGHVGAKLVICDGKGNPTEWKRCADRAVAEKVGALIVESFPPELIKPSLQAAQRAKVPVIDGNNGDPSGKPGASGQNATKFFSLENARVAFQYSKSGRLTADWVIADSKGTAHVLILRTSDVPNAAALVNKGMQPEFKTYCPGCAITIKDVPIAQWSTSLGTLSQTSLNRDPSIKYVIPVYDGMSTFVLPAIQQAGKANKVKVATFNADLDPMKNMAKGNQIFVDVGSHNAYEGWAYADQALRLMTGHSRVADEHVPIRVFTRANVKQLALNPQAERSGIWYGPPTYKKKFLKLWQTH